MRKNAAAQAYFSDGSSQALSHLAWPSAWLDSEGTILQCNPALQAILPKTGITAASLPDYLNTDDAAGVRLALARLRVTGEPEQLELELRTEGAPRHFTASFALAQMTADSGTILVQLADITQIKTEMDDLAIRESRWNHALVSSASGVWDQHMNGEYYYSEIWRRIRGLRPDDPIPPTTTTTKDSTRKSMPI